MSVHRLGTAFKREGLMLEDLAQRYTMTLDAGWLTRADARSSRRSSTSTPASLRGTRADLLPRDPPGGQALARGRPALRLLPPPRPAALAWLREVLPSLTRTVRHGGNHRYLLPLARGAQADVRRLHGEGLAYPRFALCGRRAVACAEDCELQLGLRGMA